MTDPRPRGKRPAPEEEGRPSALSEQTGPEVPAGRVQQPGALPNQPEAARTQRERDEDARERAK